MMYTECAVAVSKKDFSLLFLIRSDRHSATALSPVNVTYSGNEILLILSNYGIQIPEMEQYGREIIFWEFCIS